jgi:poly(3-hydroxybutyrate) depolymerase
MAIASSGFEPAKSCKIFMAPAVLLIALLVASANAAGLASILSPGNHTITLSDGARERSAIVHLPPRAVEMRAIPVVLNFHGGGGHEQEYSLMDGVADREVFVAVYPNGTGLFGKPLLTWNAGTWKFFSRFSLSS